MKHDDIPSVTELVEIVGPLGCARSLAELELNGALIDRTDCALDGMSDDARCTLFALLDNPNPDTWIVAKSLAVGTLPDGTAMSIEDAVRLFANVEPGVVPSSEQVQQALLTMQTC